MKTYHPKGDYILVEIEPEASISPGGIVLLEPTEESRQRFGRVLSVGPGAFDKRGRRTAMSVKVGDRVAFSKHYIGRAIENLRIFREPSVHYVCEPNS